MIKIKINIFFSIAIYLIFNFIPMAYSSENFTLEKIDYSNVMPTDYVLEENYGGMGISKDGWVYFSIDGYYKDINIEDTAILRYHSITGKKEFLGSLRKIAEKESNLLEGEGIAKVHAPIFEYNGIMYLATHPFHNPDDIQRGSHFFSYNPINNEWKDLSKNDPNGISAPGQGIIAMAQLKKHAQLAGFTYPKGEIVVFDFKSNKSFNYGRPINSNPYNVSRHIIATDKGKVYFSYANYNTSLYEFDVVDKTMKKTSFEIEYGWLSGVAYTSKGTKVYFVDWLGYLYELDVYSEVFTKLGKIFPDSHSSYKISKFHGLIISNDDRKLYCLPEMDIGTYKVYNLFEYNIETKEKKKVYTVEEDVRSIFGGVSSKNGYMYFHDHNYSKNKNPSLLQIFIPGNNVNELQIPTSLRIY